MITLSKSMYQGKIQVELDFIQSEEIEAAIASIPTARFSAFSGKWYMDNDAKAYRALKALGYKIVINKPGPTVTRANTSIDPKLGTTHSTCSEACP